MNGPNLKSPTGPSLNWTVIVESSVTTFPHYVWLLCRFASSFCSVWKNDENILLLLSAIALFTPDRANVVHQAVIKKVQVFSLYLSLSLI